MSSAAWRALSSLRVSILFSTRNTSFPAMSASPSEHLMPRSPQTPTTSSTVTDFFLAISLAFMYVLAGI